MAFEQSGSLNCNFTPGLIVRSDDGFFAPGERGFLPDGQQPLLIIHPSENEQIRKSFGRHERRD
jgi:hypothetical protein